MEDGTGLCVCVCVHVQVSGVVEIGNKMARKEGLMKFQQRPERAEKASYGNSWVKIIPGNRKVFQEIAKVVR